MERFEVEGFFNSGQGMSLWFPNLGNARSRRSHFMVQRRAMRWDQRILHHGIMGILERYLLVFLDDLDVALRGVGARL